jgi:hypothetical protein
MTGALCCVCSKELGAGWVTCSDCEYTAHPKCTRFHPATNTVVCDTCDYGNNMCPGCKRSYSTPAGPKGYPCNECDVFTCVKCHDECDECGESLCGNRDCTNWYGAHEVDCVVCYSVLCIEQSIQCDNCGDNMCDSGCANYCTVTDTNLCVECYNETCAIEPHMDEDGNIQ